MSGLLRLVYEFFKIGLFAVGGGPATIPFLYDLGRRLQVFTPEQLANMIAISQCTPGPLGINMATYVGYNNYGFIGGVLTTFGLVFPSLVTITIISKMLQKFRDNKYVDNTFKVLRPCVVGFILSAAFTIFSISVIDTDTFNATGNIADLFMIKEMLLFILMLYLVFKYRKHPFVYLALGCVIGIIFRF